MFKRRKEHKIFQKIREFVWPKMGWLRFLQYYWHRITRLSGSTYHVAAGLACGVGISFTPFLGFHFILAGALAWIVGGNVIASAVGTFFGNPWTFPVIWIGSIHLGDYILGTDHFSKINFTDLQSVIDNLAEIFYPMVVGGSLLGLVFGLVSCVLFYFLIRFYQRVRANKAKNKVGKE